MLFTAFSSILLLVSTSTITTTLLPAKADDVFTAEQESDVIRFVESLRQCRRIVGVTLAVVRGNATWTRGLGLADREGGREVSTSDLFGIGSVTKAFTSALLSLLIDDTGRYSWDTPVADILGQDFQFATEELTRQLTVKDMLIHRTGLEDTDLPLLAGSNLTAAQYAKRIRHLPVKKLFRDEFEYNNWMYGLAGNVAEAMGGAPWEELLRTRLLGPLNMADTALMGEALAPDGPRVSMAKPYVLVGDKVVASDPAIYRLGPKKAAGEIGTSAEDMTKWMKMLLNRGRTEQGRQLVSEAQLRKMTSPHMTFPVSRRARWNLMKPHFPATYVSDAYGLAWNVASYRGYPMTWHSGGFFAYITYLGVVPDLQLAVFVSTNGPGTRNASHLIREAFFYITDVVLGEGEPWLNTTNACRYPDFWRGPSSSSSSSKAPDSNASVCRQHAFQTPDRYAGRYQHPLYGDVEVVRNGSRALHVRYGFLEGRLCGTGAANVAVAEVEGSMAFAFQSGGVPKLLQLVFSQPLSNGTFRQIDLSQQGAEREILVFHRASPSSSSPSRCGGDPGKGLGLAVLLLGVVHLIGT